MRHAIVDRSLFLVVQGMRTRKIILAIAALAALPGALCVERPNAPPLSCQAGALETPCNACARSACCPQIEACAGDAACQRMIRCRARGTSFDRCAGAASERAKIEAGALFACWGSARCTMACAEDVGAEDVGGDGASTR
jgi:hypothetical protein